MKYSFTDNTLKRNNSELLKIVDESIPSLTDKLLNMKDINFSNNFYAGKTAHLVNEDNSIQAQFDKFGELASYSITTRKGSLQTILCQFGPDMDILYVTACCINPRSEMMEIVSLDLFPSKDEIAILKEHMELLEFEGKMLGVNRNARF